MIKSHLTNTQSSPTNQKGIPWPPKSSLGDVELIKQTRDVELWRWESNPRWRTLWKSMVEQNSFISMIFALQLAAAISTEAAFIFRCNSLHFNPDYNLQQKHIIHPGDSERHGRGVRDLERHEDITWRVSKQKHWNVLADCVLWFGLNSKWLYRLLSSAYLSVCSFAWSSILGGHVDAPTKGAWPKIAIICQHAHDTDMKI